MNDLSFFTAPFRHTPNSPAIQRSMTRLRRWGTWTDRASQQHDKAQLLMFLQGGSQLTELHTGVRMFTRHHQFTGGLVRWSSIARSFKQSSEAGWGRDSLMGPNGNAEVRTFSWRQELFCDRYLTPAQRCGGVN